MNDRISFAPSLMRRISELLNDPVQAGRVYSIGLGDYADPLGSIVQARARQLFWHAFSREAPEAMKRLLDNDTARRRTRGGRAVGWIAEQLTWFGQQFSLWDLDTLCAPPWDENKGGRLDLHFDVLHTLARAFETRPDGRETLRASGLPATIEVDPYGVCLAYKSYALSPLIGVPWGGRDLLFDMDDPLDISIAFDDEPEMPAFGWNPVFETRGDAEARLSALFESLLTRALNKREQEAQTHGLVKVTSTKRSTVHFRWLVRYQCLGQDYAAIGRDVGRTSKTVADGVADAARLLSLVLREPVNRGGRPRKAA